MKRRTFLATGAGLLLSSHQTWSDDKSFDTLLAEVQANNDRFPGAAGQIEAKELSKLVFGAAQPNFGKSLRLMDEAKSQRTIDMIRTFEVSNPVLYHLRYEQPVCPGKDSGVTIAIGYDLGYVDKKGFEEDWRDYIKGEHLALLESVLGLKREVARAALPKVMEVRIPYDDALKQFKRETLPKYVAQTEYALKNTTKLTEDSLGALVSLTFNRGPSYLVRSEDDKKGNFREMREIRKLMREENFSAIPQQIRSMKRLWANQSDVAGLLKRRELEAKLFEFGLLQKRHSS